MLQRQGSLDAEGEPVRQRRTAPAPRPAPVKERTSPAEFVREVRAELRKVAWPTRAEVINYSLIVLVAVVILTAMIAGLDFLFGEAVLRLFET